MSSNESKQKATGTDSDNNYNSVSSEAEKDDVKQQHSPQKDSEKSTPKNDPASTSATATSTSASVATAAAGHPPSQSRLTNLPPQVPRQRRVGFREQFLQKVRSISEPYNVIIPQSIISNKIFSVPIST